MKLATEKGHDTGILETNGRKRGHPIGGDEG